MIYKSLKRCIMTAVLTLSVFSWSWGCVECELAASDEPVKPGVEIRYHINDGHQHFLDLVQESEGMEALLKAMDRFGVDHTMLTGFPVVKKWDIIDPIRPGYYLDNDSSVYYYTASDLILAPRRIGRERAAAQKDPSLHLLLQPYGQKRRGPCEENARMVSRFLGRHRRGADTP